MSIPDTDPRRRFEAIAEEIYEPLQRYLRRRATAEDADELLSDVLLTVWRRLPEVPAEAVLPWCYGVARRALANQRRGHNRYRALLAKLASQPQVVDTPAADDQPLLTSALRRLPESDREILRLWAWEQLEPREIALVIGSTANAASLRLTRAKKKLSTEMGRQDLLVAGHTALEGTQENGS